MLTLHYATGTISIAVAIALEEARLPYETIKVDFASAEQTQAPYLALNPKGRVPLLVLEDGTRLTETGALLEYIATIAPGAGLLPEDPVLAAHVRGVMYYLASTMHVAHAHRMRGSRWATRQESFDDMTAKVPENMAACGAYLNELALLGAYVAGDRPSIADPYLFTVLNWMEGDGAPLAAHPRLAGFMDRMNQRDSVMAIRQKGLR